MVVVTQNKSRTAYLHPPGVPDNLALGSGPTVAAVSDLRGEGPKPLSSRRRYYRRVLLHSGSLVSHHWRLTRTTRCHQVGPPSLQYPTFALKLHLVSILPGSQFFGYGSRSLSRGLMETTRRKGPLKFNSWKKIDAVKNHEAQVIQISSRWNVGVIPPELGVTTEVAHSFTIAPVLLDTDNVTVKLSTNYPG